MRNTMLPALLGVAGLAAVALAATTAGAVLTAQPAVASTYCVHPWAVPGSYRVTGQFRKRTRSTTADVAPGCRVSINVPGVFTGGPLKPSGRCVTFGFRVEGEPGTFTARWCNNYVVIPYNGRDVRAAVERIAARTPRLRGEANR